MADQTGIWIPGQWILQIKNLSVPRYFERKRVAVYGKDHRRNQNNAQGRSIMKKTLKGRGYWCRRKDLNLHPRTRTAT